MDGLVIEKGSKRRPQNGEGVQCRLVRRIRYLICFASHWTIDLPWKLSGFRSDAFKLVLPMIMKTMEN